LLRQFSSTQFKLDVPTRILNSIEQNENQMAGVTFEKNTGYDEVNERVSGKALSAGFTRH